MPTLFLRCGTCRVEFPTPIAVTTADFQGKLLISGLTHRCPKCGAQDQFFTADYFVHPEEAEAATRDATATVGRARTKRPLDSRDVHTAGPERSDFE
jgi:hypothetical protein